MKIFAKLKKIFADEKRDIFDWNEVPSPDPDDVAMWIGATDAKDRQFPLQLARQVHDELEALLMSTQRMDALEMAQVRGGVKALARFAQVYAAVLEGRAQK